MHLLRSHILQILRGSKLYKHTSAIICQSKSFFHRKNQLDRKPSRFVTTSLQQTHICFFAHSKPSLDCRINRIFIATQPKRIHYFQTGHNSTDRAERLNKPIQTHSDAARRERHPSPPHVSISQHSQQFWAIQFSILPNWISFPRALHAQLLHPKRRRSIKDNNVIRRDAALRMRTVHKRNP